MKLKEFIKKYYGSSKEITTKSDEILYTLKELILPGTFRSDVDFKKTMAWNLDRDVYFREVTQENGLPEVYVTLTTGKIDLYVVLGDEKEFQNYIECGLKKHRQYRKENLTFDPSRKHLFYSRKYE
jgi:adenosylcobinamide amidohydrolase